MMMIVTTVETQKSETILKIFLNLKPSSSSHVLLHYSCSGDNLYFILPLSLGLSGRESFSLSDQVMARRESREENRRVAARRRCPTRVATT